MLCRNSPKKPTNLGRISIYLEDPGIITQLAGKKPLIYQVYCLAFVWGLYNPYHPLQEQEEEIQV